MSTLALDRTVALFAGAPKDLRLAALLEYSRKVPPLPEDLAAHPELMEQVPECQTPFFLAARMEGDRVRLHFSVPAEAPTTRGFAGILWSGLDGATPEEILAVPSDFYTKMGLAEVISALRLRGMSAILGRLKRQVGELLPPRGDVRPFEQRTRPLGLRIDVSNVAEVLEVLDGPQSE